MTKQEMWDLINKENAIKEENEANIATAEKKISELQNKIDVAIRKKDSAAAIKFTDQLEAERRKLEIYRDIISSYQYGVDISQDDFMKCFNEEVSIPYNKRLEELKAELNAKRDAYIADMKKAYRELIEIDSRDSEFCNINLAGKLGVNIPSRYPGDAFRDLFINETRYFFED